MYSMINAAISAVSICIYNWTKYVKYITVAAWAMIKHSIAWRDGHSLSTAATICYSRHWHWVHSWLHLHWWLNWHCLSAPLSRDNGRPSLDWTWVLALHVRVFVDVLIWGFPLKMVNDVSFRGQPKAKPILSCDVSSPRHTRMLDLINSV